MNIAGKSNIGKTRRMNQDSFAILENEKAIIAAVCDGIGGAKAGEVASKMACDLLIEEFKSTPPTSYDVESITSWFKTVVSGINEKIWKASIENLDYSGMGTTLVGFLAIDDLVVLVNVGDSRIYGIDGENELIQLTEDHSLVSEMVKRGKITAEQAKTHPQRNILINALGVQDEIRIDISLLPDGYKWILLCSDGLHGYVEDDVIASVMKMSRTGSATKADRLIELANQQGGYDNVTVVIASLKKGDIHA